ncbi:MAG TPA: 4-(cytidine 5'-diphospho)-2-C-methyl-D-erythritol kinase [Thermodesulfobacteriota bacterium]|nr:4-(cytidine 5'-diphospho)-2-C-methyl-D-erythritol kinase [Thermodesulfobacteriota bacterium]
MKTVTLLSSAKVNLTLQVLRKRTDGYHEIRSIIQPVSLFDEVRVVLEEGEGIEIESSGIKIPLGQDNLAWKAAHAFTKECGLRLKVRISINKKIPLGAGLGGGSGNAAAVLVAMNRLTRKLAEEELLRLSPKIGADVAFFIRCRSSIAQGVGEKITLINNFPLFHYVLVNPGFEVSTKRVYELWDEVDGQNLEQDDLEQTISLFRNRQFPLRNDLENVTSLIYPEVKGLKERMVSMGAEAASMTGSGPIVFGVFEDEKKAKRIYDFMKDSKVYKVFLVQGISGWHKL